MKNEIILYHPNEADELIEVRLDEVNETFWLSLSQKASLFDRDKSVISRHLKNIFNNNELDKNAVVAKNATTAADGKKYNVEYYNLGTQFRIWATTILRDYLLKGIELKIYK